jgi:hypothetical protein
MTDQRRIRVISEGVVASYIHDISSRATPPAPPARSRAAAAAHTTSRVRRPRRLRMRPSTTTVSTVAG